MSSIARDEHRHLFKQGTSFRLHKDILDTGIYTYHVYCSQDESKYPLMLNNPNPNSITIRKGIFGYTLLDNVRKTLQMMSVVDNVAFIEYLKASDSQWNKDLHVCSSEPYIYSLTEIDSRKQMAKSAVSQNELETDFSNEMKSLQPKMPKLASDIKRKQLDDEFYAEFSRAERTFLEQFDFSESGIDDRELQHLFRILVENNDVFSNILTMLEKLPKSFMYK